MSTVRTVLIIAAAIVVAIFALAVIKFVASIVMSVITIALFAAAIYVVYLIARSALRARAQRP